MMDDKQIEKVFQEAANQGAEPVAPHLWERLEMKLVQNKQSRQVQLYKYLAGVAAAVSILFAFAFLFNSTEKYNPEMIAYVPGTPLVMEELSTEENDFYDLQKFSTLAEAYERLESNEIR